MILAALTALVFGFTACEKTEAPETVAVIVTSPIAGDELGNGHALNVNVTFTDPTELHTYSLLVINRTASDTLLNISGHSHSTSLTIDTTIAVTAIMHSDYALHAEAENHSGETAHKHVEFHVHN